MGTPVASLLTVGIWLGGSMFIVTNGQSFTQGLIVMGCALFGAIPWLPLLSRRNNRARRIAAGFIILVSMVLVVTTAMYLPAGYETQR